MKEIYLLLLVGITYLPITSQTIGPGGVPGAVVWMKTVADTKDLNGRYRWEDISGDSLVLKYYNTEEQYSVDWNIFGRSYNFHPSLLLINTNLSKELKIKSGSLSTSTLIGAFAESDIIGDHFAQPDYLLALNGSGGKGFVLNKDKIINSVQSNRGVLDYGSEQGYDLMYHAGNSPEPTLQAYKERTIRSFSYLRTNRPVTGVWGEKQQAHLSIGEKFYPENSHNTSDYDINLFNPHSIFTGYIPELIFYDRLLTPLEKIKVETYLALKYGFMLENSYIGSYNQLLWDIDQQKKYNYRVTGLYRDDKSGLYQTKASTSYEEFPYVSYSKEGDSYDQANNYNLSNRNRLLVIEKFPATPMCNYGYMIWGDNNQDIRTQPTATILGMKLMNRRWLMKTDFCSRISEEMVWQVSANLEVEQEKYKISRIKKINNTSPEPGYLYSRKPLSGYQGHISFTLTYPLGGLIVKFGTQSVPEQKGRHDYGLCIDGQGNVFPIIKGIIGDKWGFTVKPGDRIRINKTKDAIIISANGYALPQTGQSLPQLFLDPEDQEKDFYVSFGFYQWNTEASVKDFRTGGFIDNGNRIELSYAPERAREFSPYKDGKSYLVVDRSGSGEFKAETTDYYLSDEYDPYRQKIVFNNVFFDPDFNGQDVFTFGYRETNLLANLHTTHPRCASKTDGSLQVKILRGEQGFEYRLENKENQKIEKSGVFFGTDLKLEGLSAGDYTLKLEEIGGFHLLSDSAATDSKACSVQTIDWDRGGLLETTLKNTDQHFQMGVALPSRSGNIADVLLQSGFEINQGRVYIITNQIKSSVPLANVYIKEGDRLQVYKDYNERTSPYKIYYRLNGVTFYTQTINHYHHFMMKLNNAAGAYHIKNTNGLAWGTPSHWYYYGAHTYPKTENLSSSSLEQTVTLKDDCPVAPEVETPQLLVSRKNNLSVYYKDFADQSQITARITLNNPSTLLVSVFDFSGNMVYSQEIKENLKDHTVDIIGLPKGVYIVKIFSSQGEFTKKITVN